MRDIRSDLHERANAAEEEIRSFYADCEKMIEQLQKERDAKVARAKAKLDMLSKLIEFENEDVGKVSSVTPPAALPPLASVVPLANSNASPTPLAQAIGFRKVS
jgi:hypothetical protein